MKRLLFPILFLFVAPAFADEPVGNPAPPAPAPAPAPAPQTVNKPELVLPATKTVPVGIPVVITPVKNTGGTPAWALPDGGLDEFFLSELFPPDVASKAVGRAFYGKVPGKYRVWAVSAKNGYVSQFSECVVEVTGPAPPPVPPGPTPPVPPGPTPPAPGPVKNARVLITYDPATLAKLPSAQVNVIYGQPTRDALDSLTPVGVDGKLHQWRIWPFNIDPSQEGGVWPELVKRPKQSQPWVVIAYDSGIAFEGPLPLSTAETVALLQKYLPK